MTEQEFKDELRRLDVEYYNKRSEVIRSYAKEINPYAVGMVLRDHYHAILVDEMRIIYPSATSDKPTWRYIGTRLTAKLRPRKDGSRSVVFQENVKEAGWPEEERIK